ncbi:MAG: benzoate-CoA ligase family protein [Actinomycetota bacterium]
MTASTPDRNGAAPHYNAASDLLGRNLTSDRAARPYLRTPERTWSYDEVARGADAAGSGLLDLGLLRGDRVLVATRDRPEFVATFWGAITAGLVPVPVAPMFSASDLHFILADSEARALVCDASSVVAGSAAVRETSAVCLFVGDEQVEGTRPWAEVCGRPAKLQPAATTEDDIALWLYTSGTTGLPKAAMHRHRHLRAAPEGLAEQVLQMEADDVVQSVSRMFFAYGLGNSVYLPAAVGASVVVSETPAIPAMVKNVLLESQPTLLFGVPAFFRGYVGLGDTELPASLRAVVSAGEALDVDLFTRFRATLGLPLLDGLGSTEALHHVTSNRPDDLEPGSAGRALGGYEVEARDREGSPLPEGETGELWVRGPTTFAGYWRRPQLTDRAYAGDWMRTGDRVRVVDGRVYHEGRLDDLVKLGGIWVAPTEIEDVLRGHPAVDDAAVVAIDDGSGVPVLKAFVVSERGGPDLAKDLLRLSRRRLASFKVPQSFAIVDELPRTPSGKLRRFVLREQVSTGATSR